MKQNILFSSTTEVSPIRTL